MLVNLSLVFLFYPKKQLDKDLKIKHHGNGSVKLIQLNISKFKLRRSLLVKFPINHLVIKLDKANAILAKIRHFLKKIYLKYSTFELQLCYTSLIYVPNINLVKILHLLQKKILQENALRVDILTQILYLEACTC